MKLALFLVLAGWYAAAKTFQGNAAKAEWQVRCLNCKHVHPATSARLIRHAKDGKTSYSLANCEKCNRISGIAIEPAITTGEANSVAV